MGKKLYLLVNNGGDGSYSVSYTMNSEFIEKMEKKSRSDDIDPEFFPGYDGDGFHYDTITLPDECTPESLGISVYSPEEEAEILGEDEFSDDEDERD